MVRLLLFFALFPALVAHAGYEKVTEKVLFNKEKLYEFRLKNGLRVLMLPRHQAKVLTYQIWFRVGSNNEKLDPRLNKTGLAHLFGDENQLARRLLVHCDALGFLPRIAIAPVHQLKDRFTILLSQTWRHDQLKTLRSANSLPHKQFNTIKKP